LRRVHRVESFMPFLPLLWLSHSSPGVPPRSQAIPLHCPAEESTAKAAPSRSGERATIARIQIDHGAPVSRLPDFSSLSPRTLPGFGGAPLGNLYRALDDADAVELVRHAYRAGIRYFDTAPHYGQGLSEQRTGRALREFPRDSFLLSTKVGRLLTPSSAAPRVQNGYVDALPFVPHYDYTREGVLRSLDDSLRRLELERIDFVFVHDIDEGTHGDVYAQRFRDTLEGALPALREWKDAGTIRGVGLGVNDVATCLATLRHADLDVILLAGRYTLADQSALNALLPECARRGVAIVLGGPYNSGILASGSRPRDGSLPYFNYAPAPGEVIACVAAIEHACAEFAVPLKAAALQFPLGHPAIRCVLPGARSRAEFDDNLAMARFPISRDFWSALRDRTLVDPAAPLPGSV
jgi:D-threo-aldose 1-dehydrogenase